MNCYLKNYKEDKIPCLTSFGKVVFELISSISKGNRTIYLLEIVRKYSETKSRRNSLYKFQLSLPTEDLITSLLLNQWNSPTFPLLRFQPRCPIRNLVMENLLTNQSLLHNYMCKSHLPIYKTFLNSRRTSLNSPTKR